MSERTYARSARRFIRKGLRRVESAAARAFARGDDAALHALRIRTKRLRYMLEFTAPLLDDRARVPLHQLEGLQDRLGALADAAMFARTYSALSDALERGDFRRIGLQRLLGAARRDRDLKLAALRTLWYGAQQVGSEDVPASPSAQVVASNASRKSGLKGWP